MEAKLKALKVVDLRHLLQKSQVAVPAKANKPDLIAKILASSAALEQYNKDYPSKKSEPAPPPLSTDDLVSAHSVQPSTERSYIATAQLALPEELDAGETESQTPSQPSESTAPTLAASPTPAPVPAPVEPTLVPVSASASAPAPTPSSVSAPKALATSASASKVIDDEAERRKARAARFGIPLVEPTAAASTKAAHPKRAAASASATPTPVIKTVANGRLSANGLIDDPEKIKARAARFGIAQPAVAAVVTGAAVTGVVGKQGSGRKRQAPPLEVVDAEEQERRRKRAQRFGLVTA